MVLWPEVIDAIGPATPVLAAGGIGTGRQMAAAMALGAARRVDRFDLAHRWPRATWRRSSSRRCSKPTFAQTRSVRCAHGQARPSAAHRVDRRVGATRPPGPAADADAVHARRRRARARSAARRTRELTGMPVGQIVGLMNAGAAGEGRHLRHGRGVRRAVTERLHADLSD